MQLTSLRVMHNLARLPFVPERKNTARAAALPEMHEYTQAPDVAAQHVHQALVEDEHNNKMPDEDDIREKEM